MTVGQRKKWRTEEKLKLIKRGEWEEANKTVLKVKEAKKIMNNGITIERNKLFKTKFDSCKGDLKTTFKIVNQLLKKGFCSKFPSHTNEKTLANSFKFFTQIKLRI